MSAKQSETFADCEYPLGKKIICRRCGGQELLWELEL